MSLFPVHVSIYIALVFRFGIRRLCVEMRIAVIFLLLVPALVKCSGEGNIWLLEDEVATAMKACALPADNSKDAAKQRQRRSDDSRIDNDSNTGQNMYGHEKRDGSDLKDQLYVLNATDYDYGGNGAGNGGEKYIASVPRPASGRGYYGNSSDSAVNRTKRNEPLLNKPDSDQCLSQCIFANLQVVDSRGIPREAELWNKVQSVVTSQQSKVALKDQIRACFQELQTEAEDNGCSYSNKLERCLMLHFSDRLKADTSNKTQTNNQKKN